jgi:hypothetical protein
VTLQLLVAVTADAIHVLNWDPGDRPGREVMRFARASTTAKVTGSGLSRIVTLSDAATGADVTLHATAAPFRPQSKPDAHVLSLLAA